MWRMIDWVTHKYACNHTPLPLQGICVLMNHCWEIFVSGETTISGWHHQHDLEGKWTADTTQTVPGHWEAHFLPSSQQQWPPPKADLQTEKQSNPLTERVKKGGTDREAMLYRGKEQTQRKGKLKAPSVMLDLYHCGRLIKEIKHKLKGGEVTMHGSDESKMSAQPILLSTIGDTSNKCQQHLQMSPSSFLQRMRQ